MWTPQAVQPVAPRTGPLAVALPSFSTYALGWNVSDYRGHRIVSHGGGVYGGVSTVLLIPERGVGIAVMSNAEERPAVNAVLFKLLDHYLGYEPADWIAPNAEARAERYARAEARLAEAGVEAGPGGPPSLPLPAYAGRYIDPWYGSVSVTGDGRGLRVSFDPSEGMEGPLEHVRFNTFRTRWPDRAIEDAYLTFNLATDGSIELIRVEAVSPLADVSFNYRDLVLRPAPESK
jgi:hypothetical protein